MGAWGADTFDNDTACDWSYALDEVDDLSLVRETLARVLAVGEEYLDSDDACEGLAACEVVARLKGNWGVRNPYTETVDKWVEAHAITPPGDLIQSAVAIIDRVLTAPSELLELWEEGDPTEWRNAVENLRSRVVA
jgi:hypothetical protein